MLIRVDTFLPARLQLGRSVQIGSNCQMDLDLLTTSSTHKGVI